MRIAVVSPFVDRRHGSERAIAELIERLAATYGCEVHLFAQRVADLRLGSADSVGVPLSSGGSVRWHRVPAIFGPQLLQFSAWFVLNRLWRSRSAFDLVLSPGINCLDADVVIVHALFSRLAEVSESNVYANEPRSGILRNLHRRAYYSLLRALEHKVYRAPDVAIAAVSRRTASLLTRYFHRDDIRVIANGVDSSAFSPELRLVRRESSRSRRGLQPHEFVLLLIGNDWATKGIHAVFESMALLPKLPLRLMIVGGDVREPFATAAEKLGVLDRCLWNAPTEDILDCYAVADVYVSPSREDSFALPVAEAMALGLPAITSVSAGVSEFVADRVNGFVLQDPRDSQALAQIITQLYEDAALRSRIGRAASAAAHLWSWDANAAAVWQLLSETAARKAQH